MPQKSRNSLTSQTSQAFTLYVEGPNARRIPVRVTRKRVKNINLRVRPDGSVQLSIPVRTSVAYAEDFLKRRSAWIVAHVERAEAKAAAGVGPLPAGAGADAGANEKTVALWGRAVPLAEALGAGAAGLDAQEVSQRLRALRKHEVERALPSLASELEAAMGVHAARWTVRSMTTRWGSCTPARKTIRIALELAAYPPECLRMVVAHELVHLMEPSHNARFHMLLDTYCPNNAEATRRLKKPPVARP